MRHPAQLVRGRKYEAHVLGSIPGVSFWNFLHFSHQVQHTSPSEDHHPLDSSPARSSTPHLLRIITRPLISSSGFTRSSTPHLLRIITCPLISSSGSISSQIQHTQVHHESQEDGLIGSGARLWAILLGFRSSTYTPSLLLTIKPNSLLFLF